MKIERRRFHKANGGNANRGQSALTHTREGRVRAVKPGAENMHIDDNAGKMRKGLTL